MLKNIKIRNAGYMWHRKYVNWQSGAELIGYPEIGKGKPVNFAYQTGIYSLYNNNLECVYIGQAGRGENTGLYNRLKYHVKEDSLFCIWERFSWFGFYSIEALLNNRYEEEFKIDTDINNLLDIFEALAIYIVQSRFNKKMEKTSQIEWYYQPAEYEEQQERFNNLKKICKSLQ